MDFDFKTDSSFTIIKGRFKAPASSSFGLFVIFIDNVSKNVEKFDVIASHFSVIYENNLAMPWNELEELISKMKWKGEYATNLTHDIQSTLEDLFEPNSGRNVDIWNSVKKAQTNKTCSIFEEQISRPTGDKNIKVEIGIENINVSDIENVKRTRETQSNTSDLLEKQASMPMESDGIRLEENAVVLDVALVLSPISGIPIYELKEGEKIVVKISEESSRGQYFIDLLNASDGSDILPIPASVVKISSSGKLYTMMLNIGPGIYGKAIEEDNVKVKIYDVANDKRKNKGTEPTISPTTKVAQNAAQNYANAQVNAAVEEKKDNRLLIFFIIGALTFVLLIIIIVLLSG